MSSTPDITDRLRQQLAESLPQATPEQVDELMTLAAETGRAINHAAHALAAQNVHRLEVELSAGNGGYNPVNVTFTGVCDAPEGAPCRLWCDQPECQEDEASDDHAQHTLLDQGECGFIESLNADPSMIPELYTGPKAPLRSGFIVVIQDIDGVSWCYDDTAPEITPGELAALKELAEYRRRDAAGRIEYGVETDGEDGGLELTKNRCLSLASALHMRNLVKKLDRSARVVQRILPGASQWIPVLGPACEDSCHHQCPECRMGLGSHLTCDPRCHHHLPAATR